MQNINKLKLFWGSSIYQNSVGNGYGYRVHCENMHRELKKLCDLVYSPDAGAEDVLLIASPEFVNKVPKHTLFLFSMFEGNSIPDEYLKTFKYADYWITPSKWVKKLFDKYFPPKKIFVCNHGVQPIYEYKIRRFPFHPLGEKFRYLWVGAPNPRKGYEVVAHVWQKCGFEENPKVELYMKSTMQDGSEGGIQRNRNVILDRRNVSKKELVDIYHSAHCFLSPSSGEGFNLLLAEAMATGLPCIATYYSGVTDFFDKRVGFPIGYTLGKGKVTFIGDGHEAETMLAYPNADELAIWMVWIYMNYTESLEVGKRASDIIHNNFTWEKSAKTLVNIIKGTKKNEEKAVCFA